MGRVELCWLGVEISAVGRVELCWLGVELYAVRVWSFGVRSVKAQ